MHKPIHCLVREYLRLALWLLSLEEDINEMISCMWRHLIKRVSLTIGFLEDSDHLCWHLSKDRYFHIEFATLEFGDVQLRNSMTLEDVVFYDIMTWIPLVVALSTSSGHLLKFDMNTSSQNCLYRLSILLCAYHIKSDAHHNSSSKPYVIIQLSTVGLHAILHLQQGEFYGVVNCNNVT